MAKPTIDVNQPHDSDIIGEGAEKIRETRQEIYNLFPIRPDDLDYEDTSNWWPAGSLTGGFDPAVERGEVDPHPDMQDRYALVGDQVAVWDWNMPEGKNILTIGLDTGTAIINTPETTNWVNIENDDKVEAKNLSDLHDVFIGGVEPLDKDILVYSDGFNQWINRPIEDLVTNGTDGAEGKGWTGTTILENDAENYVIRFDSAYPELVFDTENLKGPAGADGTSAYQLWLDAGNTGTEQDFLDSFNGTDGEDGESAYQIAVNNGFVGTEQQWLDSLVGPQGDGIHVLGHITDSSQLPPSGNVGDAYLDDNGHLWIWENSAWVDAGQVQGPQGEVGPSITLVPGTATKLDHQANPTVTLTDLGNDSYQYDFGIPAGTPAEDVDLEPLENRVSDLETDVGNLQTSVNDVLTDISDIQAEQVVQNAAIQVNQDKNDEQDARLDGLDTSVSDNAAAIEVNANAIADIQNIQSGSNTVPDPAKGGDILASNDDLTYGWKTIDLQPLLDLRDTVQGHEVEIYGETDPAYKGIKERVEDLETQVEAIGGTDPADHVSQQELSDALYGVGNDDIANAVDGVYGTTNAITSELESVSQRVSQNEIDIEALQTSTGDNASAISDLDGRVTVNEGNISQNTADIQQNQTDISNNAANIAQNTIDIATNAGNIATNTGDIATNAGNIATNTTNISTIQTQLTPTSHETILTSVDNGDGTFSTTWATNAGGASYDIPTDSTGYFAISVGTTEQEPPNPEPGWVRFNTDVNLLQWSNQQGGWDTAGAEPKPVINSHTMDSDKIYKYLDVTVTATGRQIYSNTKVNIYADGVEVHETGITNLVGNETFDFVIPGSVTNALATGSNITVRAVDAITNISSDTYLIGEVYEWKPRLSTYAFPTGYFLKNKSDSFAVIGFNFTPNMTAEFFCDSISLGTSAVTDINTVAGNATVNLTQSMAANLQDNKPVTVRVRCDDRGGLWSDELYVADVLSEDGVMRSENYYTGSGTYTKSLPYIRKIDIVVQGGGGGGGFINHGANNGGAGGGGATAETLKFEVVNIASANYVVGGGGSRGNADSRRGGNGGTSNFSCSGLNMQATGGAGGSAGTTNTSYAGGGGGTATGGLTRNMNGNPAKSMSNITNDYGGNPGCGNEHGGSGRILSGGNVTTSHSRGGGGLGGDQSSSHSGGAGGFVLIREYS